MIRLAGERLVAALVVAALTGCAGAGAEPQPAEVVVAPPLAPPPSSGEGRLTRERALEVAQGSEDPADAIAVLDARPFDFELTEAALRWFGERGVAPAVMDYLRKRSRVDWGSLRGDVDPKGPGSR